MHDQWGTWTTMDCPTGGETVINKAYEFLKEKFEAVGGRVRKLDNLHDGGQIGEVTSYPSFEIDHDRYVELNDDSLHDYDECFDSGSLDCELCTEKDELVDKLNEIGTAYDEKFADNL